MRQTNTAKLVLAFILCGLFAIACFVGPFIFTAYRKSQQAQRIRPEALRATMQQAEPLITAIKAYTAKQGQPPATLEALIPTYLRQLPTPGSMAKNGWQYLVGNRPEAGGWSLFIHVRNEFSPNTWSFGDVFVFHPSGIYARSDYGGILEPVGRWGYYHE